MRLKDISKDNRPKERVRKEGISVLSNSELLAIILQKGTKNESVIKIVNRLISKFSIEKLPKCSLLDLKSIKGIGEVKAMQILALFELNKRFKVLKFKGVSIKSAKQVYEYAFPKLAQKDKENFMVLHLNSKNKIIKDEIVSIGTLNSSLIHPREVFKSAIKENANSIIIVHNHPSGDPKPSLEDKEVTKTLIDSGNLLGIKVLDHIIVGDYGYYSFNEEINV